MPIRAVTFDFWNTIAAEPARGMMRDARHAAVLAASDSLSLKLTAERVGASLDEVIAAREASWREGRHLSPAEGAETLADALELEADAREAIAAAFLGAGRGSKLAIAPHIGDTLERLAGEGLALGIVCDAGFTGGEILRGLLEDEGLLPYFSGWGFSDEVGTYKPAAEIFEAALAMLGGVEPAATVHIGDLRRTDIAGAQALGMGSVRYRGLADDGSEGPEGDFVIDDHRDLPGIVAGLS
ncbi:MAG: hypothetical protein BGO11_20760 [Solirubrobacterales bacterium 70-9]|nr:MAG: hypothetical protein BGO11_20760 [Solirubrobacterales bacterium 70-9]